MHEIVATLRENGLKLPMGSLTRRELLQKLWNLNMHLDAAVNNRTGYHFELHNKYGRPVAMASSITGSVEVLEARMVSGWHTWSS